MTAWVFAGGAELARESLAARLSLAPPPTLTVAADSGWQTAAALGIVPQLLVGDLDSLTHLPEVPDGTLQIHKAPCRKDETDTALAIREAVERGCREILLIGGFGGRSDHFLCNLLALEGYLAKGIRVTADNGSNRVRACTAGERICLPRTDGFFYFGLLALSDQAEVTVDGCAYPLTAATLLRSAPYAISNEWTEEQAVVTVHRGSILLTESER